ncbi:MAG: Holliday junction resolvase RuvX [Rhodospirillaceae bacterium]|nr:Holliday junction resolvase RuvX [Rhodospirillaceae bacterium]
MELPLSDLPGRLARGHRLLGLDMGTETIGLAVSDTMLSIATPTETIRRTKFSADAERLAAIVYDRHIGALVYGLPKNMDGSEGPRCQSVREFAREFDKRCERPYAFWDERLSTAAVERMLVDEADMSRKRRAQVVDRAAAAYILQGALDALAAMKRNR